MKHKLQFNMWDVMLKILKTIVVEWLKHHAYDQHCLGLKPTHAILLCPWQRHFIAFFPAWWS